MVSLEYDESCNALCIRIKKGKVTETEQYQTSLIRLKTIFTILWQIRVKSEKMLGFKAKISVREGI